VRFAHRCEELATFTSHHDDITFRRLLPRQALSTAMSSTHRALHGLASLRGDLRVPGRASGVRIASRLPESAIFAGGYDKAWILRDLWAFAGDPADPPAFFLAFAPPGASLGGSRSDGCRIL
jgi:hypothetical protein